MPLTRVYIESGICHATLPCTLRPNVDGTGGFTKTPSTACGAVGVFTYDLLHIESKTRDKKVSVMFSVPFDDVAYTDLYAVGVCNKDDYLCDDILFKQMYRGEATWFSRDTSGKDLTWNASDIAIKATMSGKDICHITVNVVDAGTDSTHTA